MKSKFFELSPLYLDEDSKIPYKYITCKFKFTPESDPNMTDDEKINEIRNMIIEDLDILLKQKTQ